MTFKIIHISDTHNQHYKMRIPHGDVLIHSGDATGRGTLKEIEDFCEWFRKLPHMHKIFVPGNHDWDFEQCTYDINAIFYGDKTPGDGLYLLNDSQCIINVYGVELVVYGNPYTPYFGGWAFNAHPPEIQAIWQKIPQKIDIGVFHGPPKFILDKTDTGVLAGCPFLGYELELRKPKLVCFGHIHEAHGILKVDDTWYSNASMLNRSYVYRNKANVFEVLDDGTITLPAPSPLPGKEEA